jgi:hypothetical protein
MPYEPLESTNTNATYLESMRIVYSDSIRNSTWHLWVYIAFISATISLFVLLVIITDKKLRSKHFNKFIVGLVIPDFIFSFLCTLQCLANLLYGDYYGGDLNCEIQSVYAMSGMTGSIWMNVLISKDLYNLAISVTNMTAYNVPSNNIVISQILVVYAFCTLLGSLTLFGFNFNYDIIPFKAQTYKGLACLPMAYDFTSGLVFWLAYVPLVIVVPLLYVTIRLYQTRKLLTNHPLIGYLSSMKNSDKLSKLFIRLLFVLLIMWIPTFFFIFAVNMYTVPLVFGGSWSHAQGFVSGLVYLSKKDINQRAKY